MGVWDKEIRILVAEQTLSGFLKTRKVSFASGNLYCIEKVSSGRSVSEGSRKKFDILLLDDLLPDGEGLQLASR